MKREESCEEPVITEPLKQHKRGTSKALMFKMSGSTDGKKTYKLRKHFSKFKAARTLLYINQSMLGMHLSEESVHDIARVSDLRILKPGEWLYQKGDRSDMVYIVGSGVIQVITRMHSESSTPRNSSPLPTSFPDVLDDEETIPRNIHSSAPNVSTVTDSMHDIEEFFISYKIEKDVLGNDAFISKDANRTSAACAVHVSEVLCISMDNIENLILASDDPESVRSMVNEAFGSGIMKLLYTSELFRGIPASVVSNPVFSSMVRFRALDAGETLFEEGSRIDTKMLFFVYSGTLDVIVGERSQKDVKKMIWPLNPGDIVGEIAAIIDVPRGAAVRATSHAVLLELDHISLESLIQHFPMIARNITSIARQRVVAGFQKYRIPFFDSFTKTQFERLGTLSSIVQYPPGEIVFDQGETGDRFYLIAYGTVGIFSVRQRASTDSTGGFIEDVRELCRIGPGRYFGEMALVADQLRNARALCISKCVILSISKVQFENFFLHHPGALVDFQLKLSNYSIGLEALLRHERGKQLLLQHATVEVNEENLLFWIEVDEFERRFQGSTDTKELLVEEASRIYHKFIIPTSEMPVNLPSSILEAASAQVSSGNEDWDQFTLAKVEIYNLMERDMFLRFKQSPIFQGFLHELGAYDHSGKEIWGTEDEATKND